MSILMIQGPHCLPADGDSKKYEPSIALLAASAHAAGKALVVHTCGSVRELVECLRRAKRPDTEMVLLDSGELNSDEFAIEGSQLCQALDELNAPYIEVHDDSAQVLDLQVHPRNAPIVTLVVNDDRTQGYSLALAIALRRLSRRMDEPRTPFIA